jgi:hypothetical protein
VAVVLPDSIAPSTKHDHTPAKSAPGRDRPRLLRVPNPAGVVRLYDSA